MTLRLRFYTAQRKRLRRVGRKRQRRFANSSPWFNNLTTFEQWLYVKLSEKWWEEFKKTAGLQFKEWDATWGSSKAGRPERSPKRFLTVEEDKSVAVDVVTATNGKIQMFKNGQLDQTYDFKDEI